MSLIDPTLTHPIQPAFPFLSSQTKDPGSGGTVQPNEPAGSRAIISALKMTAHPEGGYFTETDRDRRRVANPFHASYDSGMAAAAAAAEQQHRFTESTEAAEGAHATAAQRWADLTRSASTSIYYLLTEGRSVGKWHRNKGRTVHTLHKGRARYVIIHADEVAMGLRPKGEARVETWVVGQDVVAGEKLQWIVEGGKYKASFLLPDVEGGHSSEDGCLISETVVPGFEYLDHDFMKPDALVELIGAEKATELAWLLRMDVAAAE
ncbi:hypothetical protein GTA08_BOTSDO01892 [Neofusicoccum parvum]|uniref:Uncharacterized protein n=1 Tax=Neofusicoccum parvum TaxID=310453 RepID=A0ACB5SJC1_9PEZI|nr:hypothetical protein GTA08_BOTSDO01892 [Neofusicoccum parvum]